MQDSEAYTLKVMSADCTEEELERRTAVKLQDWMKPTNLSMIQE